MTGRSVFAAALLAALALGCSTPERSESAARRCVADNGTVEWEFDIPGGLSGCDGIEFDFLAEGLEEFDTFEVRFRSGKGGYLGFFEPGEPGRWNHVSVRKSGCYKSASSVAGWNAVTRFALSGQRDRETKRTVRVSNVRALRAQPEILVVRPDSATKGGSRNRHVREACVMTSFLSDLGVAVSQTSDADLAEEIPPNVALLVFPDNPSVPTNALPALERYVGRGGKFLVMCEADGRIARLAGFSCKPFYDRRKEPRKPRLAGLVRTAAGLEAQPSFVPFRTNCLMEPRLSKDVIAVANWADADGRDLGLTGVARTPNGFCYSSDWRIRGASARAMMRALLLDIRPAWRERLEAGERRVAERMRTGVTFGELPRPADEVRALTCHNPKGLPGWSWDESARLLKDGGFNTLIVNVAWGGLVFEEEAKECLKACRKHGISCHFWKVCWRRHREDPAPFAGRKAVGKNGVDGGDWMCPADPANRKAELAAFERLAALGPDGIMLDYIRYNNGTFCHCDVCKRTETDKEAFFASRRETMTSFVRELSQRMRSAHPEMRILASVIAGPESARGWFGQDWTAWAKEGLVDAVCPMNYYLGNSAGLCRTTAHQRACCGAACGKVIPCLGLGEWPQLGRDAERLAEEVNVLRDLGCGGFVVFDFTERALDALVPRTCQKERE